jgi:Tfp pilus assembly protein PilO
MNRRAVAIGVAGLLVFVLAWYFLLWHPRTKAVSDAKARRAAAEQQQTELEASINRLKAAAKNEPRLRAQLETLRTSIPDDPNLAQFILDTNDAANQAGLDFVSIAPSLPTAANATSTAATPGAGTTAATAGALPPQITVGLQMTGGYFPMIDFLNRLNDMPRLVVVDTVNVSASLDPNGVVKLAVSLSSRMFVHAIPAGFGPVTATGSTTTTTAGGSSTTTTTASGAGR